MTGVVLQARIDSSRLPGKALLLLDGKPMIFRVMEALNHVKSDLRILACPEDSISVFKPLADEAGFHIISGSKNDVLKRYCKVIRLFSLDRVIRATGDNPFVFADAASVLNDEAAAINADYSGYSGLPYGAGVESVSAAALLRAENEAVTDFDREHVCPYLYNNPEKFRLHRPLAPPQWRDYSEQFSFNSGQLTAGSEQLTVNKTQSNIRVTVDTPEDYERAVTLYDALKNEPEMYCGAVIIRVFSRVFAEIKRSS